MSAELKRLAEAATPGPWISAGPSFGAPLPVKLDAVVQDDGDGHSICRDVESHDDCLFIAAASPDVILKLIAERDELIKQLELAQMKTYLVQISDVAEQRDALCEALKDADIALARCEFVGAKAMDGGDGAIDVALVKVRAALALVGGGE